MPEMLVWGVLAVAVVLVIAAVVVGREARRLADEPPRPVFDLEEAVHWVAENLPFEVSAVMSHDDVRRILEWNLEHLRASVRSANGGGTAVRTDGSDAMVGGTDAVDLVMARAQALGLAFTTAQVRAVLEAEGAYLQAIGAIGPVHPEEVPPSA